MRKKGGVQKVRGGYDPKKGGAGGQGRAGR